MATTKTKYRRTKKSTQVASKGLKDRIAAAEQKLSASNGQKLSYNIGDTVRVHVKIKEGDKERIQAYEGVVIAQGNHGGGRSFNVRKMSHGVGVERIFQERSNKIAKLEVVSTGKVRRAKLYYLRELQGKAAKLEKGEEHHEEAPATKK